MNLELLISAAEYVERRDREMEHGYASSLPAPIDVPYSSNTFLNQHRGNNNNNNHYLSSSLDSNHSQHSNHYHNSNHHHHSTRSNRRARARPKQVTNRSTHNELEKNRRAHLRTCLDKLKADVPLGPDSSKHTTLGLLNRSVIYIHDLNDQDGRCLDNKDQLKKHQAYLLRRLEELGCSREMRMELLSKRRSVSESSTLSSESSLSSNGSVESFSSESDDVDMMSYGSSSSPPSDLDDSWLSGAPVVVRANRPITGRGRGRRGSPSSSSSSSSSSTSSMLMMTEPSLTGEIIGSSSCLSLTTKGTKPLRGTSCDRIKISNRRTISCSSSDGGMASFTKRLTINENSSSPPSPVLSSSPPTVSSSLPKINVISNMMGGCEPRIRIPSSF